MWREAFLAERRAELECIRTLLRQPAGHVHLLGIGGVGVAGVALHLKHRNFRVSGCDIAESPITAWLTAHGIEFTPGHGPGHITSDVRCVIRSAAVRMDDAEVARARALNVPVIPRGVALSALLEGRTSVAVSGTHGKTTTSAMIAQALRACGVDASFAVGAEVDALGGVAGVGASDTMVVEADESDGTVALYEPDYAVITNLEMDHMDFFHSLEDLEGCFTAFGKNARRAAVICADDDGARKLMDRLPRVIPYGLSVQPDLAAKIELPVPGRHNIQNALAAYAVLNDRGVPRENILRALKQFKPARRRFEIMSRANEITVVSDYAHHPTEIRAMMEQVATLGARRVLAVFQPHRYSRTRALGADFANAFDGVDELILVPVYAASEAPLAGGTSEDLARLFGKRARLEPSLADAWKYFQEILREGDALLVIGAGDVEKIAFWARDELNDSEERG